MSGSQDSSSDGGNGSNGGGNGGDQGSEDSGPSTVEKAVMVISVGFTLALFAFVIAQALTTPTAVNPTVSVLGTQPMENGDVRVEVRLTNPSDVGIQFATAQVNCTSPPPEIQFQHIPADDYQIGYVVCPSGTTDPNASVSSWIEA